MDISDVGGFLEAVCRLRDPARVAAYAIGHVREVTGARFAEVVAADHRRALQVLGTSDASLTRELLRTREEVGDPPRPDPRLAGSVVVVHDLASSSPWDRFARLAVERTPVRSAVLPYLMVGAGTGVVLPVFDDRPAYFTPERQAYVRLVSGLTAQALRGLADAEAITHLTQGLRSRAEVGVAVGILVSVRGLSPDAAFHLLRVRSQHTHRKLRDLAAQVVLEGDLADDEH